MAKKKPVAARTSPKRRRKNISVLEAVDNLSNLAELDVEQKGETPWLDPKQAEQNQAKIKETFSILNDYLQHLYQKERTQLNDPHTQRGIRAMMQLADEAVDKVGKYTDIFKESVSKEEPIPEFQQLQQFYLSKIVTTAKKEKPEEAWEKEAEKKEEAAALDIERQALKDLESVRSDHEYELFYINKEDGMPFFNPNLLRHIRMVGNFDESLAPEDAESPLERLDVVLDRDFHTSAKEILKDAGHQLEEFYKDALKYKESEAVASLNKAVMALMLAANPRNLIHNNPGKHCDGYFIDFQTYLRETLQADDYRKFLATSPDSLDPFFRSFLKVAHLLCGLLFLRVGAHADILGFLQKLVEKEKGLPSFWETLMRIDHAIRSELKRFPSGPLLKILEAFREEREKEGFDPILQKNPPSQLFAISSDNMHMTFLHLPCPVHQEFIDKAEVVGEFKGFLRYMGGKKHLLVNLQDRTSWKEHNRSLRIEELPKEAEFGTNLIVMTLAKNTEFYHQSQDYAAVDDAKAFCAQLKEQVESGEQCGFYFPSHFQSEKIAAPIIDMVHDRFFEKKPVLTRRERLDFIEIFYFFLLLRILDKEQPDSASFTCKDAIDTGAAQSAAFYGFARMLSRDTPWSEEDKNFFLFSLYAPALLVRHRPIDSQRLLRTVSALGHFESALKKGRDKILKACADLFPDFPVQKIKVSEAA
jgi:hypothetical protein